MRTTDYAPRPSHIKWLLDSDPAIRWQVLRDLADASPEDVAAERTKIATKGWGAKLLSRQAPNGKFGGAKEDPGLLTTFYCVVLLKDFGLDPASKEARRMVGRIDKHLRFKWHSNRRFFHGETEPCINGRILGAGAYFQKPDSSLLQQLLDEQLDDGGWNCEAPKSRVSSFHTTICVLEGLLEYEQAGHGSAATRKARQRGENYLLERRLFRSKRTGEIVDKHWLRFGYPTFWHYDVLRGLDYLRSAGMKPDEQVREAVEVVVQRGHQNGRWPLNLIHRETIPLKMETVTGSASRWNTLRALRVLRWYNSGQ
jgi:hypothetical protein